jgi:hypothetical protein
MRRLVLYRQRVFTRDSCVYRFDHKVRKYYESEMVHNRDRVWRLELNVQAVSVCFGVACASILSIVSGRRGSLCLHLAKYSTEAAYGRSWPGYRPYARAAGREIIRFKKQVPWQFFTVRAKLGIGRHESRFAVLVQYRVGDEL